MPHDIPADEIPPRILEQQISYLKRLLRTLYANEGAFDTDLDDIKNQLADLLALSPEVALYPESEEVA